MGEFLDLYREASHRPRSYGMRHSYRKTKGKRDKSLKSRSNRRKNSR